ncbi:hypothetical protein [Pseudoduganella namucuonensis]|uniref:Uncharacterized protein n=1 Tax=Pseudoduganella namucuonensis TaxID=1035707 RepID=A0A1I7M5B7_9BURK|nr:hypothetical protein [Pseudoduganella namucuonensis]SFV17138.1 hypothetical protein SAMN05216552_10606 [Pseudoduganella namucuonensis]
MPPYNRRHSLRPHSRVPRPSANPRLLALDAWLQRLSAFAQVGLALFTIVTIYTTVIPLYQKSVLDEAIAKKEVELKTATTALETKYIILRRFAVRDYVQFTVPGCIGLLRKIPENADEPMPPDPTLTLDVKQCIVGTESTIRSLSELRQEDRTFFREQLTLLGDRLAQRQLDARTSVAGAHLDVNNTNMNQLAAKRVFESRLSRVLEKMATPQQLAESKRRSAIAELEYERTEAYRKQVSNEMFGLLKLAWPASKQ